jgi:hypothetical protein
MTLNRIPFQPGLSMPDLLRDYGTEAWSDDALEAIRWPKGFLCRRQRNIMF